MRRAAAGGPTAMRRSATSCAASLARAGTRTLTTWCLGTRWVKLAELVENIDEAGRKGRHARCTSQPHKTPSQIDARPPLQKFFRCAGQRLQRLAAHDILHGGRRAEKGGRSERKVQKYAARHGGSGNQGAVAQFSTGRRCGNWQCTGRPLPGEQWLLPLHHSSSGAWLKPCPWLEKQFG